MWVNKDSEPHHLISEDIENDKPDGIFNSGIIHPKKCYSKKFDIYTGLIDYYCVIHPAEWGFKLFFCLGYPNNGSPKKFVLPI